nr:serine/arginine repetitive matrix protein 1-like [Dermacentor andersoni]
MQNAAPIAGQPLGGSPRRPGLPAWPPPPTGGSPARGSSPGRLRTPSPLRPSIDVRSGSPPRPPLVAPGVPVTPSPHLRAAPPAGVQLPSGWSPARPIPVDQNVPPPPKPGASPSAGLPKVAPFAGPPAAEAAPQVVPPSATSVPAVEPVLPSLEPDTAPGVPLGVPHTPPSAAPQAPAPAATTFPPAEGSGFPATASDNLVPALSADSGVSPSASGASATSAGAKSSETRAPNGLGGDALILNKLTEIQDLLTKNAAEVAEATRRQMPLPRYRFAFGPPFSDRTDASKKYWSSLCAETPVTQAQPPMHFPPTTVTILTTPDPPPMPPPEKPATEKKSRTTPPEPRLSREKVYVEETEEHASTEESYKGRRRFIRDRHFRQTDEEDEEDNGDEDSEDEDEDEEGEEEDYDYNAFKGRASRNRRCSYQRRLQPKAERRQPTAAPLMMGRYLEPPTPAIGTYRAPSPYYMHHQAQAPMVNFYQPSPPMGAMFPPPDGYQPPAPMMQPPPPMPAYPQEQPRMWTNHQQWPQPTSAPPESSFPEIGIVHREERIEYECASGQTCQVRTDNRTTVSADSGFVNRTPAQEHAAHGDGRVPCLSRQPARSEITALPKTVTKTPEKEKRLQLTPNVALKIARDVEENNVTTPPGDKRKEVEIKITEQVVIAMKDDDETEMAEENTAGSCTQVKVETPAVVVEARSEIELQAESASMPVAQKGGGKSPDSSDSSDSSESSEGSYELPVKHQRPLPPVKRKRGQDARLQRLIKLERLLREKMAKNPELRKMLPEEVFLTKDETARIQERQEREATAAAVQQRDEAAQTMDAAQADINRLLQLEADLKAELAKLQCARREPLSGRAMVEDGREKLKSIAEATLIDRAVFETPKKERVTMRDLAVGVHYDVMESPGPPPPSPEPGCEDYNATTCPRPRFQQRLEAVFNSCACVKQGFKPPSVDQSNYKIIDPGSDNN